MKVIERCCECAYYSMRKHKCKRGAKDKGEPTARFYADCPLDEAEMVRRGTWEKTNIDGFLRCSVCHDCYIEEIWLDGERERWNFCPHCGADLRGEDDD